MTAWSLVSGKCRLKGLELAEIISDEGVSGGKPLGNREGGGRLLKALQEREADSVVMLKLDRMFRNAGDCLATIETWDRTGVSLHVVDLGGNAIDTTSAAGRFMLVVLAGAAEMERNLIRERTKSALAVKKANGQRTGSVPYGCDLAEDGVALIENPTEQAVVHDIVGMRGHGWSYPKIAECLTEKGIRTKQGNTRWNQATIRGILVRAGGIR